MKKFVYVVDKVTKKKIIMSQIGLNSTKKILERHHMNLLKCCCQTFLTDFIFCYGWPLYDFGRRVLSVNFHSNFISLNPGTVFLQNIKLYNNNEYSLPIQERPKYFKLFNILLLIFYLKILSPLSAANNSFMKVVSII